MDEWRIVITRTLYVYIQCVCAHQKAVFDGDHFQVTYSVTNHWNSQYQSELSIRNTGDAVIQDWCLIYPNTMTIDQIWNGTADCYDTVALIHNCGYNQDIPVGGCLTV